jgi:SAM-dependent methyltransferase
MAGRVAPDRFRNEATTMPSGRETIIDAEELARTYTVEDLAATAEQYFARLVSVDHLMGKPFSSASEAPTVTAHLGAMLFALELSRGMDVLDFGAGTCWTSRCFAQLGCSVVACDVSPSALAIGERLFDEMPLFGHASRPSTLWFDGHHIDLPDESIDRVACMDAFHHVPNRPEVLAELCRVLRPGGRAVMAEGGPRHSRTPQSQAEMRAHTVVERDIVVADLALEAKRAGFARTDVGIYAGAPALVRADDFEDALEDGVAAADAAKRFLDNHRLVVFHKAGDERIDSRSVGCLVADITVVESDGRSALLRIANTSPGRWLGGTGVGSVLLGAHLYDADGSLVDFDFCRHPMADADGVVEAGSVVETRLVWPDPPVRSCVVEIDLVSEGVGWFAALGGPVVRIPVT